MKAEYSEGVIAGSTPLEDSVGSNRLSLESLDRFTTERAADRADRGAPTHIPLEYVRILPLLITSSRDEFGNREKKVEDNLRSSVVGGGTSR